MIFMMGFENISIGFNTSFEKDSTFTMAIEDFIIQQD